MNDIENTNTEDEHKDTGTSDEAKEVHEASQETMDAPDEEVSAKTEVPVEDVPVPEAASGTTVPAAPVAPVVWPATRVGTKRHDAQMIFIANSDKSMDECIKLAAAALKCSAGEARSHYVWQVNNEYCPGKVTSLVKVPRTPSAPKASARVTLPTISTPPKTRSPDEIRATQQSVEEKIRAARALIGHQPSAS